MHYIESLHISKQSKPRYNVNRAHNHVSSYLLVYTCSIDSPSLLQISDKYLSELGQNYRYSLSLHLE